MARNSALVGDLDLPPFDDDLTLFCGVAGEDDDLLGGESLCLDSSRIATCFHDLAGVDMSLNSADPPLPGSSCESATISMTAGRAINLLDPSELSFPKVAVLGLAEGSIVLCRLLFFCSSCTRKKPAVSLTSVELVVRLITTASPVSASPENKN